MTVQVADETDGPDHSIIGGLVRLARLDEPPYSPSGRVRVDGEASPWGTTWPTRPTWRWPTTGLEDAPEDEVSSVVESTSSSPAGEAGAEGEESRTGQPDPARHELNGGRRHRGALAVARAPRRGPEATATGPPRQSRPSPSPPARPSTSTARSWSAGRPSRGRHPTTGAAPAWWPFPAAQGDLLDPSRGAPRNRCRPRLRGGHGPRLDQRHRPRPAGAPPEDLLAGVPVPLQPGAILDVGDGVTIKVSAP